MTTPSDPENGDAAPDTANLAKEPAAAPDGAPFDPYRFGRPDHPIPAEYAPPGYTGPIAPTPVPDPYAAAGPGAAAPPASAPANPFGNPPGTPYHPGQPYAGGPPSPYGSPPPYGSPQPYGAPEPYGSPPPYGSPQPHGYGPPPPQYSGYTQPGSRDGKAIAALVLGIGSIVFCWLSIFDAVFVVLALIFGIIALNETKDRRRSGRGMAVAGLVCMVVGALLATIISIKVFSAVDKCGGFNQSDRGSFNQCLKDNL